jgi:PAS domain S-box-containing protein
MDHSPPAAQRAAQGATERAAQRATERATQRHHADAPAGLSELRIRRHANSLLTAVLAVGICLAMATWGLIFHGINTELEAALAHTRSEANNVSAAFRADLTRTLDAISIATAAIGVRMQADPGFNIHDWQHEASLQTARLLRSVALIGPDGVLRSTTLDPHPEPIDLADRAWFRTHLDGQFRGLFVSQPLVSGPPLVGGPPGKLTIMVSRRIEAADGSLLGVVVFNLVPNQLTQLHKVLDLRSGDVVSLVGGDNIIRVRFGNDDPDGAMIGGLAADPPVGMDGQDGRAAPLVSIVPTGHVLRLFSIRQLDTYPLFVSVGLDLGAALLPARLHARQIALVGLIATALLVGVIALLITSIRRRTHSEIRLYQERNSLTADLEFGRRAEARLRRSEQRLRDFAEMASDWFWEQDAALRFTMIGPGLPVLAHGDIRAQLGKTRWEMHDTGRAPAVWQRHRLDVECRRPFRDFRYDLVGSDGQVRHVSVSGVPVYDEVGAFAGYRGTGRDITQEVAAAEALRAAKERAEQAEALLRDAVDSMSEGFVIYDRADRLVLCNTTYRSAFGSGTTATMSGTSFADILKQGLAAGRYLDAVGREDAWLRWRLRHHRQGTDGIEIPLANGQTLLAIERRMRNGGVAGLRINITALKQAQSALRDSEARLDRAQEIAGVGSWELDVATGGLAWSKEMYRIRGLSPEHFEPTLTSVPAYIHTDDRSVAQAWITDLQNGIERDAIEYRIVRPNGEVRMARSEARLVRDPQGTVQTIAGTLQDITERRRIEQRLVHAQKMEAIGNLTGGMAHDFNNLLGVIIGNLHLLSETVAAIPDQRELCDDALGAARRGADLTRGLLAFGRRQSLHPRATDINRLVTETTRLLARMLGEHIVVDLQLAPELQPTVVDAVQLEAAITNLATNARDAMPRGGHLTITTRAARIDAALAMQNSEAVPGEYVVIEVTDTGVGMPTEVISRVFEPFFTTKDQGKGTGLGLSMVFGFIKQSGGHVSVYSEPGHGTTMRLYLPYRRAGATPMPQAGNPAVNRGDPRTAPRPVIGGNETVLLVEDNRDMRRVAVKQLTDLGYTVIEAGGADAALEILRKRASIDLLLTDIVMPGGIDGVELAEVALSQRPDLHVLLMSGFSPARFEGDASLRLAHRLISKPFDGSDLAVAVRETLDLPPEQRTRELEPVGEG